RAWAGGRAVPGGPGQPDTAGDHQGHRNAAERAEDAPADAGRRLPEHPGATMSDVNAILAIAYRDLLKFLRDRARIGFSFIFPIFFIGILGGSLQSNLGAGAGYNLVIFTFTG